MNKIYKVIWSKAKHTYVVASEIAKGHTKGETTGKGLKKLAAALLVAAALMGPNFAWAEEAVTIKVEPASGESAAVEVYTKYGADKAISTNATNISTNATNINTNTTNINGLTTRVNALESSKTDTALHISSSGDLIVGTKENQTVKDMEIRGKLTSGSISTGDITSTGDVTVAGKMAADGVTDETTKDGTYIKQNNTVGKNLGSLDTQVKANADAINEEARKRKYSVTNLENADKQLQTNIDNEAVAREAKDNELNERITNEANAIHDEIKAGDEKLDTRITNVKEYLETQTSENYVSKTDAAVQDAGVVKADKKIGENVTALGKGLYDETAARIGADAAQDKVIQAVNNNLVQSVTTINKNVADGFTALNQADAKEAEAREAKDNELNERITNEANAIHDEIKAGDEKLDTRITNVKEYLETQTSENYVSKTDAAVQDAGVVKADKKIGENVTALGKGLYDETAARIGADKAQDQVIAQVNQNMANGFNTINTNMANGFAALNAADAAEKEARIGADKKLAEAVNSGLSLRDDNVLQKNTTTVADDGTVTTSKSDANEMILNKGNKNQITLNEKGVKVGTNSSVMDADGIYTGGDTFDAAKAAMSSDGQIKGANGKFTVDASGNTTVTSLDAGTGTIQTKGDIYAKDATFSGDITAKDATLSGDLSAKDGTFSGDLSAKDGTFSGDVSAKDVTATGTLQGAEVTDGTATMKNGNITGVKDLSAETITTSGDATIGGDLTVKGKLNVDEIDLTKNGIVGDNNVTASTKVAAGEIISSKTATSTKDGSKKESAINYDENGTSTWAIATDADKKWNKSTLTVEGSDVTSKVIDSDKNSNTSTQTASESNSTITGTADGKNYKSYITQNLKNILQGIKEGTNESIINQTETGIKSTATAGKNTASTNLSNEGFNTYATDGTNKTYTLQTAESLTSQIGDDGKVKSVMNADGITNNADGGTITNSAKDLVNTATGNMTNTVGGKLLNDVTGDMENKVGGNLTTAVTRKVTEDFKSDLTTTIGGNKSEDVKGTSTETVTGKKTENYNGGLETTVTGEEKHTVNGSQTNSITGDQVNTIGGKQTTTVTGDVTEDYKANLSTTVGGSQTTTVTGDSSLTAENINNTATNKITNKALDVETEAKSSIMNKVSNDYGSNTSTQLSYETKEEMSANGKTASYLRGAVEEKSQLTDGAKKTTIDTVAGQTNTNITEGKNISNSLQKADQAASSVTDGANTTVVNQDAKSLASSITDGTKANNTNNTVDKSEQLIKASDTQYSATTKTATKMEDALVSGSSVIDVIKNLDDAANPSIGSAVTDGTNSTGVTQTAKDITNTAKNGTITNEAKDITNHATENMTNTVANDLTTTVGGKMKTTVTGDVTEDYKANLSTTVGGNQTTTVTGDSSLSAKNITNKAEGGTIYNKSKDILNEVSGDILNFADGEIGNSANKITNLTGDNTVTSDTNGTTFENKAHSKAIEEGSVTKTTISGNTLETGKATMDYAEVMKDLGVHGNATVDKKLTVKGDSDLQGNATVGKDLEVKGSTKLDGTLKVVGKSTFKDDVTMEKNLDVKGTTTTDKLVVNNGATVTGGTTTDTLKVTGSSEFDGKATFNDIVTMNKGLSVTGGVTADTVTADSYKVGDKTYIDKDGINANNQVIRNVGQGNISEGSTDAVSGGQLYETNTRVSGLETRMGTVETRVDKLDGKIDKVGANAAAMANLHPLEFDEDSKWNIAAAVGSSGSETASAVGVFYRPNENVMVNASAAMGTGENMFGGGVSLRLGHGGNKAKEAQMKAAAAENKELRAKVDDLTARMDALLSVLNPNMSKDFPDVPENHWAYEAVSRLAGNGIVEGYEDGKYHGERQMTRYEMAEIIYNALSKGAKAEKKLVEEFRPELQAMAAQKKA